MANLCIKTPSSAIQVLIFQLLVLRPRPTGEVRNRRFCLTKYLSDGQSWPPERDSSSFARDTSQLLTTCNVYRESINLGNLYDHYCCLIWVSFDHIELQDTLEKYYTTESQRNAVTLSWDHVMAQVFQPHQSSSLFSPDLFQLASWLDFNPIIFTANIFVLPDAINLAVFPQPMASFTCEKFPRYNDDLLLFSLAM